MRIAFIGQKGIPADYGGGVERIAEALSVRMAREGNDVFVYARNYYTDKNICEYKGVHIIHLPTIRTKHLDAITHTLLATIHAMFSGYDVIHYHAIGPAFISFLPRIFLRRTVIAGTLQSQDYFHSKWGWFARAFLRLGEWMMCRVSDALITVTDLYATYTQKKYSVYPVVIPNGADIREISSLYALKKWGLEEKKYIFSASRLVHHKEIHTLIAAFRALEKDGKVPHEIKLVIAGDGEAKYRRQLEKVSGGSKNIIFVGNQSGDALAQLFFGALAFVQPSKAEGMSLALLEAMGYGAAPIVSDIPENVQTVGDTGEFFEVGNKDGLAEKILIAVLYQKETIEKGRKAKRRTETLFNWDFIVKKTMDVYWDMLFKKRSGIIRRVAVRRRIY